MWLDFLGVVMVLLRANKHLKDTLSALLLSGTKPELVQLINLLLWNVVNVPMDIGLLVLVLLVVLIIVLILS
jgi:hypothetical protein